LAGSANDTGQRHKETPLVCYGAPVRAGTSSAAAGPVLLL